MDETGSTTTYQPESRRMLTIEEIERGRWDCLVVGTGVGGATLGSVLANAGWKVLFVEKGRAAFQHDDALRGTYPESSMRSAEAASLSLIHISEPTRQAEISY